MRKMHYRYSLSMIRQLKTLSFPVEVPLADGDLTQKRFFLLCPRGKIDMAILILLDPFEKRNASSTILQKPFSSIISTRWTIG